MSSLWRLVGPAKDGFRHAIVRATSRVTGSLYRERPRRRVISLHNLPDDQQAAFHDKLLWLSERCNIVSLAELSEASALHPQKLNAAITFDDGYKDCIRTAAPVLRELGLPATFFVCSGAVGLEGDAAQRFAGTGLRRREHVEFLDAEDLRQLATDPLFEIGGHATTHADLGVPRGAESLEDEVALDRQQLQQITGVAPRWFAYPFGQYTNVSAKAMSTIRAAGYKGGHTDGTSPSFVRRFLAPALMGDDRWLLGDNPERRFRGNPPKRPTTSAADKPRATD